MLLTLWQSILRLTAGKFLVNGYNGVAITIAAEVVCPPGIVLSPAIGAVLMSLFSAIFSIDAVLLRHVRLSQGIPLTL